MRSLFSAALIAVSATVLSAQTTTSPSPGMGQQQSVTMNGCITAGPTGSSFMLSNAMPLAPTTVPQTSTMTMPSGAATTGAAGTVAGTAGTTGTVAGTGSVTGSTGATPGVPPGTTGVTAGTTGTMTSGTGAGTTGVTGTAGAGTTPPTTGVTGAAGVAGAPPAVGGVPPMPASTYQLSGTSVSPYVGQSVQVTGMLVPSPNVAATAGAQSSGVTRPTGGTNVVGATTQPMPQFQVTKVEPLGIRCPQ